MRTITVSAMVWFGLWAPVFGQPTGTLRGQVSDESGAVIPGTTITLQVAPGVFRTLQTGNDGTFNVNGLTPGTYTVRASAKGMALYENAAVEIVAGKTQTLNISLKVSLEKQEVTVADQPGTTVSTDPSNNAGSLVLRGADLDALSDDPDDLQSDLQALAGPSAGPNGGQIYIDGFTDGRLPPKESIREIRINQNPFSAEYDRLGYGRIEILTKPGSDRFHGQGFFNFSDDVFNARNPFADNRAPFQMRSYGGNVGGPLSKRASFFFDVERREIDDNAVINATILDASLNITPLSEAVLTPQRRTTFSPRLDYQLTTNNTLTGRYSYTRTGQDDAGIGQFTLAPLGYNTVNTQQTVQVTEMAVLNARAVNETRFQFIRSSLNELGNNSIPTVNVLQSFVGGGSQIGHSYHTAQNWELQNYVSLARGRHAWRFGVRVRAADLTDVAPQNFGGTFTFSGGLAPVLDSALNVVTGPDGTPATAPISSIQRYQRTLVLQQAGIAPAQIRVRGGGASQFSIAAGNPEAGVTQADVGVFVQDDWRMRPNLTVSLGLRYETQTNIHDWSDLGPRVGVAWAPGAKGNRPGKTVVRGGFGMFYDRFADTLALQTERFNGVNQQQFIVSNPDFFPEVPAIGSLGAGETVRSIHTQAASLRAPYTMQAAVGVERQLPRNTTMAVTFTNSHALHLLLTRDINAPLPGTVIPGVPGSGVRPYGNAGEIFQYESDGVLNQNQMIVNLNSRMNRSFTLFTFYVLNYAHSSTDGATTMPANPYNLAEEYGRAAIDVRHRFVLGGSIVSKWNLRFSPFVIVRSGSPFDITTGRDANGDSVFVERPALAADPNRPGVLTTRFGVFDPSPTPEETIIPRNYGGGPAYFTVNLRLSRAFGFGPQREAAANSNAGGGGDRPRGGGGGGRGGPGGPGGMRMGGGGGFGSIFGDSNTGRRYSLVISVSARNLLNTTNDGPFTGNLTSPFFGRANSLAGGFGPAQAASNRRLDLQLRFLF